MASKWTDRAAQLRRLWRLPADVAQAGQASAHATETLVAGLAGVAARLESLQAPDARLAEIPALRDVLAAQGQELAALRAAMAELTAAVPTMFERQDQAMQAQAGCLEAIQAQAGRLEATQAQAGSLEAMRATLDAQAAAARTLAEERQAALRQCLLRLEELGFDQLAILARGASPDALRGASPGGLRIVTEPASDVPPIAAEDARQPRFVAACERLFPGRALQHVDLGCGGGGLVWDFLAAGHQSWGVAGDRQQGFRRVVPGRFLAADLKRPFQLLREDGKPAQFDIITAWGMLERMPADAVAQLFGQIRQALGVDGVFVASVANFDAHDPATGAPLHLTLQPREWWLARAAEAGLRTLHRPLPFAPDDFVRGAANPRCDDWDARWEPSPGFHLTLESAP